MSEYIQEMNYKIKESLYYLKPAFATKSKLFTVLSLVFTPSKQKSTFAIFVNNCKSVLIIVKSMINYINPIELWICPKLTVIDQIIVLSH